LLDQTVVMHGGPAFHWAGDDVIASFDAVAPALCAAVAIQHGLLAADWAPLDELRVRLGVHRDLVVLRDGELHGSSSNGSPSVQLIENTRSAVAEVTITLRRPVPRGCIWPNNCAVFGGAAASAG